MTKPAGYYDLRQALAEPGCPLCRLLARDADRYVETVLYELVTDVEARLEFSRSQGYCREHSWLMARRGASLGVAILMLDVLEDVLRVLEAAPPDPPASALQKVWQALNRPQPTPDPGLAGQLSAQVACPVCDHLQTNEAYYLTALWPHLAGPDNLLEAYRASAGLCLPHLRLALDRAPDGPARAALVELQKEVWQRLRLELREFIRKNDYRFAREEMGLEGEAWLRALEAVAGAPPPRVKEK